MFLTSILVIKEKQRRLELVCFEPIDVVESYFQ